MSQLSLIKLYIPLNLNIIPIVKPARSIQIHLKSMKLNSSFHIKRYEDWSYQKEEKPIWSSDSCILQKISNSAIDVQIIHKLGKKRCFNLCLLNDFKDVSEINITQEQEIQGQEMEDMEKLPDLNELPHLVNLLVSNSGTNHISTKIRAFGERELDYLRLTQRRRILLNRVLKNHKGKKIEY